MLTVYSRLGCERCARVKKQLSELSVSFAELTIGEDVTREELLDQFPEARQLPLLVRDGKLINIEDIK